AAVIAGGVTAMPSPAAAQIYFGTQPPVVDYERDRRREMWRQRREMERQDAYEQGRRDARRSQWDRDQWGERRRPVRCEMYRVQRPDEWGRMRTYREQRCR
ncbi:MAG: hypothetical protein ACRCXM_07670, partial [Beijerinckiaceae bacterium]